MIPVPTYEDYLNSRLDDHSEFDAKIDWDKHLFAEGMLTRKQKMFVIHYNGDATRAAEKAEYANPPVAGKILVQNKKIYEALKRRDKLLERVPHSTDPILTLEQIKQELTQIALDTETKTGDKLKALDMLAKTYGGYVENLAQYNQINQKFNITVKQFAEDPNNSYGVVVGPEHAPFGVDSPDQTLEITHDPTPTPDDDVVDVD